MNATHGYHLFNFYHCIPSVALTQVGRNRVITAYCQGLKVPLDPLPLIAADKDMERNHDEEGEGRGEEGEV